MWRATSRMMLSLPAPGAVPTWIDTGLPAGKGAAACCATAVSAADASAATNNARGSDQAIIVAPAPCRSLRIAATPTGKPLLILTLSLICSPMPRYGITLVVKWTPLTPVLWPMVLAAHIGLERMKSSRVSLLLCA